MPYAPQVPQLWLPQEPQELPPMGVAEPPESLDMALTRETVRPTFRWQHGQSASWLELLNGRSSSNF